MVAIRFDTAQIDALASSLRKAAQAVRAQLDHLDNEVARVRELWSGEAEVAYETAHRNWRESAAELQSVLNSCADIAAQSARQYNTAEKAALKLWS